MREIDKIVGLVFLYAILNGGCGQIKEVPSSTVTISPVETVLPVEAQSPTEAVSPKATLPTDTQGWQTYHNVDHKFSVMYPSDWIIESESYQSLTLKPQEQISWQPSTPADIAKTPAVRIDYGEYIRERIGSTHFPETISFDILKTWIEKRTSSQEFRDFSESSVDNFQALEVTEINVPGCEKVVYWRPVNLKSLVRISTGCESSYLEVFNHIVKSVQQIE